LGVQREKADEGERERADLSGASVGGGAREGSGRQERGLDGEIYLEIELELEKKRGGKEETQGRRSVSCNQGTLYRSNINIVK
jgi:hypothetical protein